MNGIEKKTPIMITKGRAKKLHKHTLATGSSGLKWWNAKQVMMYITNAII